MTVYEAFRRGYGPRVVRTRRTPVIVPVIAFAVGVVAAYGGRVLANLGSLVGLGLFAGGAFTLGLGWGLMATGLAVLVADWLITSPAEKTASQ